MRSNKPEKHVANNLQQLLQQPLQNAYGFARRVTVLQFISSFYIKKST